MGNKDKNNSDVSAWGCAFVIILLCVSFFLFDFAVFLLIFSFIGIITYVMLTAAGKADMARKAADMARQEALNKKEKEKEELSAMLSESQSICLKLPEFVASAETHLNRAEQEFSERVFASFWDEIEHAINELGKYHHGVTQITNNAASYATRRSRLSTPIPDFSIAQNGGIPDARHVAVRLSEVVREGQKDYQFASIYEQRKTNQLLYKGFGTLADGINQMQYAITGALKDLSNSLDIRIDDLAESFHDHAANQAANIERLANKTDGLASEIRRERWNRLLRDP